jgi:hypothetical protein
LVRCIAVAASVAGIFDNVIDERIFGGPMGQWLPASSGAVVQTLKKAKRKFWNTLSKINQKRNKIDISF